MDRTTRAWILCILATSLVLNLWGINFGLPDGWHPDEIVGRAAAMARRFSLNPHEFRYGALHFYQVLAVTVPTYLVTDLLAFPEPVQKTAVYLAARGLTAILGVGCVALVFLVARQLYNATAGIVSAMLFTLTMGFVNISHYATVDIPMLFWMLASFLNATHVLHIGDRKSYVLAGIFAGLAAGTKYPGGAILLSLFAAHFLRAGLRDHVALLYGVMASVISFVAVNPPLLLWSCEFFEGFIKEAAWQSTEGAEGNALALYVIWDLYRAAGPALGVLIPPSLVYALAMIYRKRHARETILVFSMLIPCFAVLLSKNFSVMRYTIPVIPPLLVLAGKMIADLMSARQSSLRHSGATVLFLTVSLSAAYTVAANLEITNDSRKLAAAWINRYVPAGSTIETTMSGVGADRGGRLPKGRFSVVLRPRVYSDHLEVWAARIDETSIYETLYPLFLRYASFAETAGICDGQRPYFEGWYEQQLESQEYSLAKFDQTIDGLKARAPDYLVVSSLWIKVDGATPEGRFFTNLLSGKSDYRQVAEIHYSALPFSWLDPEPEFINPTIRIFRRTTGPENPSAESDGS